MNMKNIENISEIIIPIEHSIVDGLYTRIAYAKAGSVIVGCEHKKGGTAVLLKGTIRQIDGEEKYEISAPFIFNTKAGTQRVAIAMTDCAYSTMHSVDALTVEDAEKELFVQAPQIARIRNSFNALLLEHKITAYKIQEEMELQTTHFEVSDSYFISDSLVHGVGSMAKVNINKYETIGIAVKNGDRFPLARYVNHSDIPNAYFEDLENGDIALIASSDIPLGNEIFVNYRERIL